MAVAIKYIGRTSGDGGGIGASRTDRRKSLETALKYHLHQHLFIVTIIYAIQRVDGSGYRSLENLRMSFYLAFESLLKFHRLRQAFDLTYHSDIFYVPMSNRIIKASCQQMPQVGGKKLFI